MARFTKGEGAQLAGSGSYAPLCIRSAKSARPRQTPSKLFAIACHGEDYKSSGKHSELGLNGLE